MSEILSDEDFAEIGAEYEEALKRHQRCVEASDLAARAVDLAGERVVARLLRDRRAAVADAGRLRAALRKFAEVFHEGDVCGVCGGAWDDDGCKHFDGCAVGAALTEADQ